MLKTIGRIIKVFSSNSHILMKKLNLLKKLNGCNINSGYILITVMSLVYRNSIQTAKSQIFKHIPRIRINLDGLLFQSGNFRNEVQSSFAFFFLQFQRNTTDGALINTAH